ncbi:MAG: response regulator [Anaerolineae bacterium]|nr:response regulator [Anaerolineae bacterium]
MAPKILIVDDEPHIRLLMEQTLEDLEDRGVELLTAADGPAALEIIEAQKPEVVFLDIMLPLLSGFEVCRKVKQELGLSDVYIIMLTAKGQEYDRRRGTEVGADVYMTKPFDPDEILEKTAELLGIDL